MNARTDLPLGVVQGMPNADYHAGPGVGISGLKLFLKSPAHYFAQCLDPDRPERKETEAMMAGTLAHCAIFEPQHLNERYVMRPAGLDLRTKAGQAWRDAAPARATVITPEQFTVATRQCRAVRELPEIGPLLDKGQSEVSAFWIDDETGVLCKCRPDHVAPAGTGVILIDGKTCQDASPQGFSKSVWTYRYDLQAAWYSDGFEKASGQRVLGFVFAAVESTYPHLAAAYMLEDEVIEKARAENKRLLSLYAACQRDNEWPGYPNTIQPLSLPAWAS